MQVLCTLEGTVGDQERRAIGGLQLGYMVGDDLAKVVRVTEGAYETEVLTGRYKGWRLFAKKAWAYPADDAQAAKKAEELRSPPDGKK